MFKLRSTTGQMSALVLHTSESYHAAVGPFGRRRLPDLFDDFSPFAVQVAKVEAGKALEFLHRTFQRVKHLRNILEMIKTESFT
jgi:hypothetical protein